MTNENLTTEERSKLIKAIFDENLFPPEDGEDPQLLSDSELLTELSLMGWTWTGDKLKWFGMPSLWSNREFKDFSNKPIPF